MRVLVTGGAGFIGSTLVDRLLERGDSVICLDSFDDFYDPSIKRCNLEMVSNHPGFTLLTGDIRDNAVMKKVMDDLSFDAVIHTAARAGVRPSIEQPALYEDVNIKGTMNLLELARQVQPANFVFLSSSSVYGVNRKVPFSETDPVDHPISPYAATKKACELICHTYHHLYGLNITCVRPFTVYGPRQRPEMAIHKFTRMIDRGETLPMFGDGTSRRDYTYIDDLVDGILRALDRPLGYDVINLGEHDTIALRELIALIEKNLGKKARIEKLPDQPGDVPVTYADITRAKEKLGYAPQVKVPEGVRKFVEWYRERSV
ncbi:MAG: NAD-dependent epimerase/dehydratase family protein [Deltaproteobacteria bacterium]|nr:NAD-dependent epimerase/dehydratase family protein [Deltaproteobacteria bacterium]